MQPQALTNVSSTGVTNWLGGVLRRRTASWWRNSGPGKPHQGISIPRADFLSKWARLLIDIFASYGKGRGPFAIDNKGLNAPTSSTGGRA